jgi:hypothetical protein
MPEAKCEVCGYDLILERYPPPMIGVALVLAGLVIGLLAGTLIVYVGTF